MHLFKLETEVSFEELKNYHIETDLQYSIDLYFLCLFSLTFNPQHSFSFYPSVL